MSIKLLAQDLYRAQQEVARLESKLAAAPLGKRTDVEAELRNAKSQYQYLHRALDGKIGR